MTEDSYFDLCFALIVADLAADDPAFVNRVMPESPEPPLPQPRRRVSAALLRCLTPWTYLVVGWGDLFTTARRGRGSR